MSKHDTDDDSNPAHHTHETLRDVPTESNDIFDQAALLFIALADNHVYHLMKTP